MGAEIFLEQIDKPVIHDTAETEKEDKDMEIKQADAIEFDDIVDSRQAIEELVILDTNGLATPLKIRVMSTDSDAFRKRLYRTQSENAKFRERRKEVPQEKQDADSVGLLVAITVGWEGINKNGQPWPCTPENAARLYTKAPHIADQVFDFARERANFTQI